MTASPAPDVDASSAGRIGLLEGIALYVCAILGAGVLVLPGQAASLAGPASLLAWGFSAAMGVPLASTMATLASRFPDAGGVAAFATRAFHPTIGGVVGWWYFIAGSVGQTIVPLTAGYYVVSAAGVDPRWAPAVAGVVLAAAAGANLAGLRFGARVQIGLAIGVIVILLVVIGVALPQLQPAAFVPFAPSGIGGVGRAVVVLFYAFSGWEAITHLSAEFRDVGRTLPRATRATVVIVTVLYLGVALAVVGTGTYGGRALDRVSLGLIVEHGLGLSASAVMAVAAVVVCFGTTNAFMASVSRLGSALGRDGWAPRPLARRNRSGAPAVSTAVVTAIGALGLLGSAVLGWGTDTIVLVPAVLVLATYLVGTAAAVRLCSGRQRLVAGIAVVLLLLTVPFAGWHLLIPLGVAVAVVLVRGAGRRRSGRLAG